MPSETSPVSLGLVEKDFLALVREAAGWCGWKAYHTHDSQRSEPGFPDLVLVRPPAVVFAELKSTHGRLTRPQQTWLDALSQCQDVEACLWRPSDWERIVKRLQRQ